MAEEFQSPVFRRAFQPQVREEPEALPVSRLRPGHPERAAAGEQAELRAWHQQPVQAAEAERAGLPVLLREQVAAEPEESQASRPLPV